MQPNVLNSHNSVQFRMDFALDIILNALEHVIGALGNVVDILQKAMDALENIASALQRSLGDLKSVGHSPYCIRLLLQQHRR